MMNRLSPLPIPFRILDTSHDLDEMFSLFVSDWDRSEKPRHSMPMQYVPQIASYIDGTHLCIRADLPGVDPKEVELTVKDNQLTLKGNREVPMCGMAGAPEEASAGGRKPRVHLMEIDHGAFSRTVELPHDVAREQITAQYVNGMLWIEIPKS